MKAWEDRRIGADGICDGNGSYSTAMLSKVLLIFRIH